VDLKSFVTDPLEQRPTSEVNSRRVYEDPNPMEIGPNPKPHEFIPYPSFHYHEDMFWHVDVVLGLVNIPTF